MCAEWARSCLTDVDAKDVLQSIEDVLIGIQDVPQPRLVESVPAVSSNTAEPPTEEPKVGNPQTDVASHRPATRSDPSLF